MADMIFLGQRIAPQAGFSDLVPPAAGGAGEGATFADTLARALEEVSHAQDAASGTVQAYLRGEPVELHQVMAATEEAGIALEMLVELRNKVTEAYRTVINMQS